MSRAQEGRGDAGTRRHGDTETGSGSPRRVPASVLVPASLSPCPSCGELPTALALLPWGDGLHTLPVAPWICTACGALAILTLATGHLAPTTDDLWEAVRQKNPVLWREITQIRAQIRQAQGGGDAGDGGGRGDTGEEGDAATRRHGDMATDSGIPRRVPASVLVAASPSPAASPSSCPVCTLFASHQGALLVQFVLALQELVRSTCPGCREPFGEHGLAHPHGRVGRVSACAGVEGEEETPS